MGKGRTNNTGTCCLCGKASSPFRHPSKYNKWLCRVHINSVIEDMRNWKETVKEEPERDYADELVAEVMRLNNMDLSFSERLILVERTFKIIA
jgi:hypothetical protein